MHHDSLTGFISSLPWLRAPLRMLLFCLEGAGPWYHINISHSLHIQCDTQADRIGLGSFFKYPSPHWSLSLRQVAVTLAASLSAFRRFVEGLSTPWWYLCSCYIAQSDDLLAGLTTLSRALCEIAADRNMNGRKAHYRPGAQLRDLASLFAVF